MRILHTPLLLATPLTLSALAASAQPSAAEPASFDWARAPQAVVDAAPEAAEDAFARFDYASLTVADGGDHLRSTPYWPREDFEGVARGSFASGAFFGVLQANGVSDLSDDHGLRLDGSFLAARAGNWIASVDQVSRWWGPGWDGSLILSNNARPFPAVSLQRAEALPFDNRYLSWIGPWSLETFMGQLDSDRAVPDPLLWGLRIELEPVEGLLIGLSRAAQWGGEGRPSGLDTFYDLLIGQDNRDSDGITLETEPGNQLGGFDIRYAIPQTPIALYTQWAGEDEAGGLPYKFMTLYGAEWRGRVDGTAFDFVAYAEYADTKAGDDFNTAYAHSIYRTGYRYRGRSLGHAIDSDSSMGSVGIFLDNREGLRLGAKLKNATINRDGAGLNSVSVARQERLHLELYGSLALEQYELSAGIDAARIEETATDDERSELSAFLTVARWY